MATPLFDALSASAARSRYRGHMPGHKGKNPADFPAERLFSLDFTEIPGTGSLFEPERDVINESEDLMARAYGAAGCIYLAGGSSQGIRAALGALCRGGRLVMERGSHLCAYDALGLFDIEPEFVFGQQISPLGISGPVSPEALDDALRRTKADAALVCSPGYYGTMADIPALAAVCRAHGAKLIVDQAHGAHLPFLDGYGSAVAQGADAAAVSLHKTLPALGMSAALLFGEGADAAELRHFCRVCGSTSPSYPLMLSMETAREYMENEGRVQYARAAAKCAELRAEINGIFAAPELGDPCRLCVCTAAGGLDGSSAAEILRREHGVFAEMSDTRNLVFICTCADSDAELELLGRALRGLGGLTGSPPDEDPPPPLPLRQMSPSEVLRAECRRLPLELAVGKIAAEAVAPYPPGVPVIAPGEEITEISLAYLRKKSYNISQELRIAEKTQRDFPEQEGSN